MVGVLIQPHVVKVALAEVGLTRLRSHVCSSRVIVEERDWMGSLCRGRILDPVLNVSDGFGRDCSSIVHDAWIGYLKIEETLILQDNLIILYA